MARKETSTLGIAAMLMIALLNPAAAQEAEAPKTESNFPSIIVTAAETRHIVDRVVTSGSVKAVDEVMVSPLVDGLSIRALNVDVGDRVEADSTLATLNDDALLLQKSENEATLAKAWASLSQYEAQLIEAQTNAEDALRTKNRSEKLAAAGTVSTAQADKDKSASDAAVARVNSAEQLIAVAQADVKVVEAQISDVNLRLARTEVKSPVSGIVSAKNARVGGIASGSGEPLFTIIRDGAVEMRAEIAESDLIRLAIGQKAKVTLADGKTQVDGVVRLISPVVDTQTRLGTVYVSILEPEKARVGMYASAEITIEEKQAIVLPLSAVTLTDDGMVARKVENNVVEVAKVETGIQDNGFVEIREGLSEGDKVIAKAGAFVRDGDHIKPVLADTQPASN